MHHALNIKKIN